MPITLTIDIRDDDPDWKELMPQITQTLLLGSSGHTDEDFEWTLGPCESGAFDEEDPEACGNCGDPIRPHPAVDSDTDREAHVEGFCSPHCHNDEGEPTLTPTVPSETPNRNLLEEILTYLRDGWSVPTYDMLIWARDQLKDSQLREFCQSFRDRLVWLTERSKELECGELSEETLLGMMRKELA